MPMFICSLSGHINTCLEERKDQWKVDRELANHSLSSTASQGTSDIPFPWFLMLGCNSQAQEITTLSLEIAKMIGSCMTGIRKEAFGIACLYLIIPANRQL